MPNRRRKTIGVAGIVEIRRSAGAILQLHSDSLPAAYVLPRGDLRMKAFIVGWMA